MTIIKKYRAKVVAIRCYIDGVYTLEMESLCGPFKYHPGQFLHLALEKNYDGSGQWPESRCFSMQSNPGEEPIKITYSVKGNFTKQMEQQLKIGSEVWLKLPYGGFFAKHHNKTNTVFIAGGTGITPFLSLFTYKSFKEYINPRIYLGFRSQKFNIYGNELDFVKLYDPKIYYEDVNGLIDIISLFSENGNDSDYFISGPPSMIETFRKALIEKGVPVNRVLTDEWE